jgi:hypothetical protein
MREKKTHRDGPVSSWYFWLLDVSNGTEGQLGKWLFGFFGG